MINRIILLLFCTGVLQSTISARQTPDRRQLRIVDTLTSQERNTRVPVLLKAEVDSLINLHMASLPKEPVQEPVKPEADEVNYLPYALGGLGVLILMGIWLGWRGQRQSQRTIYRLQKQVEYLERSNTEKTVVTKTSTGGKGKLSAQAMEKEIELLQAEVEKKDKELQSLEMVMTEYRHIKQEYEAVKQQVMDVYKLRNYPGYAKEKTETEVIRSMLSTERSVAYYAYEHFLKPVIAIADANKNNPAKTNEGDREKMIELLLSLALLYSEYLYLRIQDLSVGGQMVQRIASFQKNNGVDLSRLKELNIEHGSRALTLRLALEKMGITHLSYPVFDETNLNLS